MLTGLCLALYVVVAVVIFLPASPWSATRVPTGPIGGTGFGDSVQMSWFLEWTPYAILHGLNTFHTALIDYPKGVDLANGGSSSALLGLVASPFTLTLGPVAAFNVMLRLALASSAGSMFLLLRRWCRWPIAFVGGLLFGFGPYMTTEAQSHLNLVFVPLFPVMVWVLYDVLDTRRRRPILMGALLGGLVGAQFLIDAELLAMFAVLVAVGLCVLAVVERRRLRARFIALALAAGPAAAVALAITGYPLWEMLVAPGHLVGTAQPIDVLQLYRADLLGPVVPTASQLLHLASLSETARRFDAGNATENASYLGVPFIALVSFLAVRFRRDRVVLASSLLGLAALVLSLGSRLTVDGHATGLALPEALFTHLPLLDNVVPARFAFAATLFLVIAVAVGADHVADSLRAARSRAGRV
ncbi:MAG: hypothetical protein ACRDV0_05905, partial [Acidimicrobiales bacterium]